MVFPGGHASFHSWYYIISLNISWSNILVDERKRSRLKMKGLIVDDDVDYADLLKMIFQHEKIDIITINDPSKVLDLFGDLKNIDFVLLDNQMPKISGVELSIIIKTHDPSMRIYLMSSCLQMLKFIPLSISGTFEKPLNFDDIKRLKQINA